MSLEGGALARFAKWWTFMRVNLQQRHSGDSWQRTGVFGSIVAGALDWCRTSASA